MKVLHATTYKLVRAWDKGLKYDGGYDTIQIECLMPRALALQ